MKTDILKFKVAMLATTLAFSANPELISMVPTQPISADALNNILTLDENAFLEAMAFRTKDAVESVLELVDLLTDEARIGKERFEAIIKKIEDRLIVINDTIINPIKSKLDTVKAEQPDSPFHAILEKTNSLAKDAIWSTLNNILVIFKKHKESAHAKKAAMLLSTLKNYMLNLNKDSSPANLQKLEEKLNDLHALIQKTNAIAIAKLNQNEIIANIKKKVAIIEARTAKNNLSLVTAWDQMLKKL